MSAAAKIVDLASYRQQRAQQSVAPSAPVAMPIVYVPVYSFVPVMLVVGYR